MALKDKVRLVCVCGIVVLLVLAASFGAGLYTGYKSAMDKYSTALTEAGELYRESERTNRELRANNSILSSLNKQSQAIIDGLSESLNRAGQQAGNIRDGNYEAKRFIRELGDILREIEGSE